MAEKKKVNPVIKDGTSPKDQYFTIINAFKHKIHACRRSSEQFKNSDIVFLWVCVNAKGLKQGFMERKQGAALLPAQQWLSVIDEAASLGANWLVVSISDSISNCSGLFEVCKWAQQVHGMCVGLHLKKNACPSEEEIALIRKLDLKKPRLLIHCQPGETASLPHADGITVWTANPQPAGEKPKCQGPAHMIFVNEKGVLYTCGLVEGKEDYRIGHVFDACLKTVLNNPKTPRKVCSELHRVTSGCDGCPSLLTSFFPKMRSMP